MKCPQCQSDNTRRFSVIYDEGTRHSTSTSKTDGVVSVGGSSGSAVGIYGDTTTTKTTSHTTLAQRSAPPPETRSAAGVFLGVLIRSIAIAAFLFLVIGIVDEFTESHAIWSFFGGDDDAITNIFAALSLVPIMGFFIAIYSARRQSAYNRDEYPQLRASWSAHGCA